MFELLNIIFILVVIILGGIITNEDLRIKKIRNKWISLGLKIGAILYLFLILATLWGAKVTGVDFHSVKYFGEVILNTSLGVLVSYIFWRNQFWSAGDAKMFILLVFLIPLHYYDNAYFPYFPSVALLLNIFLMVLIFIFSQIIISVISSFSFSSLKNIKDNILSNLPNVNIKEGIVNLNVFILLFVLMSQTSQYFSHVNMGNMFFLLILLLVRKLLKKYLNTKSVVFFLIITTIVILLFSFKILKISVTLNFLPVFIFMITILLVLRKISDFYIKNNGTLKISLTDLQKGMVLSEDSVTIFKEKESINSIGDFYPDGLTEEQLILIRKYSLENSIKYIEIYRTMSFSLWIFIGALITILIKQSLTNLFFK